MYRCTRTRTHTHAIHVFTKQPLRKPAFRGLICALVPSLVKFKRVNKSLPPEQPSSSPFHVHICSLYVQKSTEARPDSVGIGLAEELEAFQLLASVVPLPKAAGSQLMAMLGTQRERTVADFPIAIAPIPAHHQVQMSHQQLETFRLMLRFSETLGQMLLSFCFVTLLNVVVKVAFWLVVSVFLLCLVHKPRTFTAIIFANMPMTSSFEEQSILTINKYRCVFFVYYLFVQHWVDLYSVQIMHLITAATPGLTPWHLHNTEGGSYSLISILLLWRVKLDMLSLRRKFKWILINKLMPCWLAVT